MSDAIIGWDVGGAHLKAARIDVAGAVCAVVQVPCALWRGLGELRQAMALAGSDVGHSAHHAVTMTGEMVDLFPNRATGVVEIARFVSEQLAGSNVRFYRGDRAFVSSDGVAVHAAAIASANWRASVDLVASHIAAGWFIDIGSTTTDIIAIVDGQPRFHGRDDYSRLVSGELIYSGLVRTPLMAVLDRVAFHGDVVPIVAEHFATMADVYRVLDELPEQADQHASADAAEKTTFASARRIARMIGRDVESATLDDWRELARAFRSAQLAKIKTALNQVASRVGEVQSMPLIGAGVGAFLVREIAQESARGYRSFAQLLTLAGPSEDAVTDVAPAVAVALLARES